MDKINDLKVEDEYGNTFTVLDITDNIVRVYERPNDTTHASNLFVNGVTLANLAWSEKLGRLVTIPQE